LIPVFILKVEDVNLKITVGPNSLKNEKIIMSLEIDNLVLMDFC
jgi:hypothetical protein